MNISCPKEIAWHNRFVDREQLATLAQATAKSSYGQHLQRL